MRDHARSEAVSRSATMGSASAASENVRRKKARAIETQQRTQLRHGPPPSPARTRPAQRPDTGSSRITSEAPGAAAGSAGCVVWVVAVLYHYGDVIVVQQVQRRAPTSSQPITWNHGFQGGSIIVVVIVRAWLSQVGYCRANLALPVVNWRRFFFSCFESVTSRHVPLWPQHFKRGIVGTEAETWKRSGGIGAASLDSTTKVEGSCLTAPRFYGGR